MAGFRVPPLLVVRLPIGIPVVRRGPWSRIAKAFMPPFWQRKWQHASDSSCPSGTGSTGGLATMPKWSVTLSGDIDDLTTLVDLGVGVTQEGEERFVFSSWASAALSTATVSG